jgi:hypothetical protein
MPASWLLDIDDLRELLDPVEQQVALLDAVLVVAVLGVRPAWAAAAQHSAQCETCKWHAIQARDILLWRNSAVPAQHSHLGVPPSKTCA